MLSARRRHRARTVISAALAACSTSASAGVQRVNLSDYQLVQQVALPSIVAEASAVAYNPDTNTLFIAGDGGLAIAQLTLAGSFINSMSLSGFVDTESLTYVGGGTFVIAEERIQTAYSLTYAAGATRFRALLSYAVLDPVFSDNMGVEGLCFDPTTGNFLVIKQIQPERVYTAAMNYTTHVAATQDLFDPALLSLASLSDIVSPAVIPSVAAGVGRDDLLILSADSKRLVNATRTGTVLSSFNLAPFSNKAEGLAVHPDGTIFVVAETNLMLPNTSSPALFVLKPRCIADFNRVNGATVQDIFDYLAAWFASAQTADTNRDGVVSVQDIFDFLAAWFQGC